MPTAYVYAPAGGEITGLETYCSGGDHLECTWGDTPVDISNPEGSVWLAVNYPTVESVNTYVMNICCDEDGSVYSQGVKVDLYQYPNAVGHIGTVWYGHIENPQVPDGGTINLPDGCIRLGYSPAYDPNHDYCYTGVHVHMEQVWGISVAPSCGADCLSCWTEIYRWDF